MRYRTIPAALLALSAAFGTAVRGADEIADMAHPVPGVAARAALVVVDDVDEAMRH